MAYNLPHLRLERFLAPANYQPRRLDLSNVKSPRDHTTHAPKVKAEVIDALAQAHALLEAAGPQVQTASPGVYLEVEGQAGKILGELNWSSQGITLGAHKFNDQDKPVAAWFVPNTADGFVKQKLDEYEHTATSKKPSHAGRFGPIETVRPGTLETLWTDRRALPPADQRIWWECWCWRERESELGQRAHYSQLRVSERRLWFPDVVVIPIYGVRAEIERLIQMTSAVEQLRLATDSPTFFTTTVRRQQSIWIDDLAKRIQEPVTDGLAVCLLDNGVNSGHPLLRTALKPEDCLSLNPDWGTADHDPGGHGTNMAGAVLFGDLTYPLSDARQIRPDFALESVKFIPPPGALKTDSENYGNITQAAVSIAEIHKNRNRVYCMAVTNRDLSGERPTSWSAALDQICSGAMPGEEGAEESPPRRLFFVSAGNIPDSSDPSEISDPDEFPVEDPAQAWNAVTVGGFTDKVDIDDKNYSDWSAVAEVGDRSPYSRISTDWSHSRTPIKPEIVFEAGNRALCPAKKEILSGISSLSLLTTSREVVKEPLSLFWATSPATAQAAGMAGAMLARMPELWPETVRALMVHSAEWTPAMVSQFKGCKKKKGLARQLLRHFGYGVPRLERALASAQNDLALIAQAEIQPYHRPDTSSPVSYGQVHFYQLPWPKKALQELGEQDVQLKITLSYFVEPSPGQEAPARPEVYQSFGLRFQLKRPSDTFKQFRERLNELDRSETKPPDPETDDRWKFGTKNVTAGSIHCDTWTGSAAELANRDAVAVFPVGGWWKERIRMRRYHSAARYALVLTITSTDEKVELYTEVDNLISAATDVDVVVEVTQGNTQS